MFLLSLVFAVPQDHCLEECTSTSGISQELCQDLCTRLADPEEEDFWEGRVHPRVIWEPTYISGQDLSPDGERVVYSKRIANWEEGKKHWELWMSDTDGAWDRPWSTGGEHSDTSPSWSPGGESIAFLSTRGEGRQLYLMPADGGEARAITTLEGGIQSYQWSPSGDFMAVLASVEETEEQKNDPSDEYIYDHSSTNSRLGMLELATGEIQWITDGSRHVAEYALSASGQVALVTAPEADLYDVMFDARLEVIGTNGDALWSFTGEPFHGHSFGHLEWSPSGKKLAYGTYEDSLSMMNVVAVVEPGVSEPEVLNDITSSAVSDIAWASEGSLLYTSYQGAWGELFRVDIAGKKLTQLTNELGIAGGIDVSGRSYVVKIHTRSDPGSLYIGDYKKAGKLTRINETNPGLSETFPQGKSEPVQWAASDGTQIEGILTLPAGKDASEGPFPLLLWPHGGPDSCVGMGWRRWTGFFSANGYAVLEPNFRGSTGYGLEHYQANRGKLGDVDLDDNLTGVQAMVDRGVADPARLVVGGISYGGTMTGDIVASTDHFVAGVSVAGVTDAVSNYGQSDVNHSLAAKWEFLGDPIHQTENFIASSSLFKMAGAKTPTLVMHGEDDGRVDVDQSKELVRALLAAGAEAELVIYPGEGHGVGRTPEHLEDHLRRWISWYEEHMPEE